MRHLGTQDLRRHSGQLCGAGGRTGRVAVRQDPGSGDLRQRAGALWGARPPLTDYQSQAGDVLLSSLWVACCADGLVCCSGAVISAPRAALYPGWIRDS